MSETAPQLVTENFQPIPVPGLHEKALAYRVCPRSSHARRCSKLGNRRMIHWSLGKLLHASPAAIISSGPTQAPPEPCDGESGRGDRFRGAAPGAPAGEAAGMILPCPARLRDRGPPARRVRASLSRIGPVRFARQSASSMLLSTHRSPDLCTTSTVGAAACRQPGGGARMGGASRAQSANVTA
jgi:hypothetical protein